MKDQERGESTASVEHDPPLSTIELGSFGRMTGRDVADLVRPDLRTFIAGYAGNAV